jgi:GMP synthase-like glutamine amidotransferase
MSTNPLVYGLQFHPEWRAGDVLKDEKTRGLTPSSRIVSLAQAGREVLEAWIVLAALDDRG